LRAFFELLEPRGKPVSIRPILRPDRQIDLPLMLNCMEEPYYYDWLLELLPRTEQKHASLRDLLARTSTLGERLTDMNLVQLRLTELILEALSTVCIAYQGAARRASDG